MHWHELTKAQNEHILESHIFVEENQGGKIKDQGQEGDWWKQAMKLHH
jgi:hypothetical protein